MLDFSNDDDDGGFLLWIYESSGHRMDETILIFNDHCHILKK